MLLTYIREHPANLNALQISKKTPPTATVWFSSNKVCILWIIGSNWAMHESPEKKLDRKGVRNLLLEK